VACLKINDRWVVRVVRFSKVLISWVCKLASARIRFLNFHLYPILGVSKGLDWALLISRGYFLTIVGARLLQLITQSDTAGQLVGSMRLSRSWRFTNSFRKSALLGSLLINKLRHILVLVFLLASFCLQIVHRHRLNCCLSLPPHQRLQCYRARQPEALVVVLVGLSAGGVFERRRLAAVVIIKGHLVIGLDHCSVFGLTRHLSILSLHERGAITWNGFEYVFLLLCTAVSAPEVTLRVAAFSQVGLKGIWPATVLQIYLTSCLWIRSWHIGDRCHPLRSKRCILSLTCRVASVVGVHQSLRLSWLLPLSDSSLGAFRGLCRERWLTFR